MNEPPIDAPPYRRRSPLGQLVLSRLREFWREPEAIFWVYGFPILMVVALGVAFRNKPVERIPVDVAAHGPAATATAEALGRNQRFQVRVADAAACRLRLRTGR